MKALFDLLQHPSLSYLEFQAPYLGLSDLWAHVTLGQRAGREVLSFGERASVAKLCEKRPEFWEERFKASFALRPAPALQDGCYIELEGGQGELGGEEYTFLNARFMVWYQMACVSLPPMLATSDYGSNKDKFTQERADILATVADYLTRWEELEAKGRALILADKAPKKNKLAPIAGDKLGREYSAAVVPVKRGRKTKAK